MSSTPHSPAPHGLEHTSPMSGYDYFQQTTSPLLESAIAFAFSCTVISLVFFSWVRLRRTSIYGSRQFFVREEHQADPIQSSTLFAWIAAVVCLESQVRRQLMKEQEESMALAATAEDEAIEEKLAIRNGDPPSSSGDEPSTSMTATDPNVSLETIESQQESSRQPGGPTGSETAAATATPQHSIQERLLAYGVFSSTREFLSNSPVLLKELLKWPILRRDNSISNCTKAGAGKEREEKEGASMDQDPSSDPHSSSERAEAGSEPRSSLPRQGSYPAPMSSFSFSASPSIPSSAVRQVIIAKLGLDHYLLLRFLKMLLSLSVVLGIMAIVALLPVYSIVQWGEIFYGDYSQDYANHASTSSRRVERLQIGNVTDNDRLWATVMLLAIFSVFIALWIWSELTVFLQLREEFLINAATRHSSRVVLLQHLPQELRSVQALRQLFGSAPGGIEYVYLCRDVSALEKAVSRRKLVLERLEELESKYMDAIAQASARVALTTLTMRSQTWLGRTVDRVRLVFGRRGILPGTGTMSEEEEHVGPLKRYQLGDMPKLSFVDLATSGSANHHRGAGGSEATPGMATTGAGHEGGSSQRRENTMSEASNSADRIASGLAALKWYQEPRRPRHYSGIPLLSKRQDSIRYYRGELCRLNKVIVQLYEEHSRVVATDDQRGGSKSGTDPRPGDEEQDPMTQATTASAAAVDQASTSPGVSTLPCAFVLMRTRAGAEAVASASIAADKIDAHYRVLGMAPCDIEWRALGQHAKAGISRMCTRGAVVVSGVLMFMVSGFAVSVLASMVVDHGWNRVPEAEASLKAPATIYIRQGVLAPLLLATLVLLAPRILNELGQNWGLISKTQTELWIQRIYFFFLIINVGLVHPTRTLVSSWKGSSTSDESNAEAEFLIHAIPSYCSFVAAYILVVGLALPCTQLLQLQRLWATLPSITLWSILGPLSWRKVTRPQSRSKQTGTGASSNVSNTSDPSQSDIALPAGSDTFEASFTPAPTQTPRQAFQLRQPPYFKLHHLYPQLVVLFTLSLALLPLAPLLFALWITVLIVLNLSYRYIVLQVVTTNSQSGGLHYLQAVKFLLFPTLACPPLVLAIYLGIRAAWIQSAFSIVLLLVMLALRYVVGKQYAKREEMMLRRVNEAVLQSEHQSSTIEDHPNNLSGTGEARSFPPGVCDPDQEGLRTGHAAEDSVLSLSGTLSKGDEGANETENPEGAPGRRRMKRLLSRPTTIIGQVRTSIIATITPQGSNKASTCSSSSSRPTSVPVFDLARYEKEILGIERDADADEEMDVPTTHSNQELSEPVRLGDPSHPRNHEREKSFTRTSDGRHAGARDATDPEFALCFSSGYFAEDGTGEGVITYPQDLEEPPLSKEQREEKEKEAKYREIVRALRRASSVATRKNAQAKKEAAENLKQQQKQQQGNTRADANPGWKTDLSRDKTLVERHKSGALVKGAKANPPANSPYFRPYTFDTSASVPNMVNMTGSSPGGLGGVGAPSLPTLFIHRESVVAAQEWSRIQGLYLNPALEDAQARVIVWLPSQTEHSFMGQGSAHGLSHSDKLPLGQCRVHTTMISDRSARGSSCQEREKRHGMCTCQLIQEVKKAMADAVALADQEIRDLRIVGLTVWLDSRHVVWGQENEEDGRLGDRVMISTAPTESTGTLSTEVVGMELQRQQRYVGDGLLSWLEDGGAHGETGLGHGAPGIIGGSMGVIMKRPIGSYGRLVGNGEDDDFSQSLGSA